MKRLPPRTGYLVLAGLLFGLAVSTAAITEPDLARVPRPDFRWQWGTGDPTRPSDLESTSPDPPPQHDPPEAGIFDLGGGMVEMLTVVLAGVLFLVLLGALLAMVWRAVQDQVTLRSTTPPEKVDQTGPDPERVRAAVVAGLEELAADSADPRAAVIGCWLRLEQIAAEVGTRRRPSDSPADLVARMLAAHQVSASVLDRLAAVYRRARYAPHDVGTEMRDEARAALRRLDTELSSGQLAGQDGER